MFKATITTKMKGLINDAYGACTRIGCSQVNRSDGNMATITLTESGLFTIAVQRATYFFSDSLQLSDYDGSGSITVDVAALRGIADKVSDGLLVYNDKKQYQIVDNYGEVRLPTYESAAITPPLLKNATRLLQMPVKEFLTCVAATKYARSKTDIRQYFQGIVCKGENGRLKVYATDGYRVGEVETTSTVGNAEASIPSWIIDSLTNAKWAKSESLITVDVTHNLMMVSIDSMALCSPLYDGKGLETEKIFNGYESGFCIEVNAAELTQVLEKVAFLFRQDQRRTPMVLTPETDCIKISSSTATGEVSQVISCKLISGRLPDETVRIGLNTEFLADVVKLCSETVIISIKNEAAAVRVDAHNAVVNSHHAIMPMHVAKASVPAQQAS